MAPYIRLSKGPSKPRSTILFTPSNTPLLSTVTTVRHGYFFVAAITCVTLLGEALNILISGVPYGTGQTWLQFLISTYASMGILGIMIIVITVVIIKRRSEPKIPRKPDTLGGVMSYMSGSRLVDDFEGAEWQDEQTRDRSIIDLRKQYEFKEKIRRDGKVAWTVDDNLDRHSYQSSYSYHS